MTRRPLRSKALVSLLVVSLCGGLLVVPSAAHDSGSITHNWSRHYKRLAKKTEVGPWRFNLVMR